MAAASLKRSSAIWVVFAVMTASTTTQLFQAVNAQADSTTCNASLTNLNVCAPFILPGAVSTTPSADCCSALQSMDHDCICNTLRAAARIPAHCNIPTINCPTRLIG